MGKYIGNNNDNAKVAETEWDYFPWPRKVWKSWHMEGRGGDDRLVGGPKNDTLIGESGDDRLFGRQGDDTLRGGEGNDHHNGGEGADQMIGWVGDDTYVVDNSNDQVIEVANAGNDRVLSYISYRLGANVERLTLMGSNNINGIGNELDNQIYGNAGRNYIWGAEGQNLLYGRGGADTLVGGAGSDLLDGGSGADLMYGGLGSDVYVVDNLNDQVREFSASGGLDTVRSYLSYYTLTDNVERLTLEGTALSGFGNELDNSLTGNAENNYLTGYTGDDWLSGMGGNDYLRGQSGDDTLQGGLGDDTLSGGSGKDVLVGGGSSVGETDLLIGHSEADVFVIGSYYDLFYEGLGHAVISDFDAVEGDTVRIHGDIADYTLDQSINLGGSSALDTGIYRDDDLIAVVQDTTDFVATRDFVASTPVVVN